MEMHIIEETSSSCLRCNAMLEGFSWVHALPCTFGAQDMKENTSAHMFSHLALTMN
jgi:hypothetical protein